MNKFKLGQKVLSSSGEEATVKEIKCSSNNKFNKDGNLIVEYIYTLNFGERYNNLTIENFKEEQLVDWLPNVHYTSYQDFINLKNNLYSIYHTSNFEPGYEYFKEGEKEIYFKILEFSEKLFK